MDKPLYKSNPLRVDQIRVVRLPRSKPYMIHPVERPLQCTLEVITPTQSDYEALSHYWGKIKADALVSINLNGEPFLVSRDLSNALENLCLPDENRAVWIDTICMNQDDNEERSIQVSMMRDIYRSAKRTLVWVGDAQDGTETALDKTKQLFDAASEDDMEKVWAQKGPWIKCLNEIVQRPYWTRAWTVQEVVLSKDSLLYCGRYSMPFFQMAAVLTRPSTRNHLNITYNISNYLKTVFKMRSPDWKDPELGLFALAYFFRHRQLTKRLDRVYAFRGLIKSAELLEGNAAIVNYEQNEEELWKTLCKETMSQHQTVLPLAVAERTQLTDASWCMDFSGKFRDPNQMSYGNMLFWSGGLDDPIYFPLQVPIHRAAGGVKAQVEVELQAKSVISVVGFTCDEIVAVGKSVNSIMIGFGRPNYVELFTEWEIMLGGPWEDNAITSDGHQNDRILDPRERRMTETFARTVTGGAWTEAPMNWRAWNKRDYSQRPWNWRWIRDAFDEVDEENIAYKQTRQDASGDESPDYEHVRDDACEGRRIIMLKSGKFGLGPETAAVGDTVAVLLGCEVPMILHKKTWSKWYRRLYDNEGRHKLYGTTWGVVGQAYIDELMTYKGDLQADIVRGKVKLETFLVD